jgi:hypothetical protein
MITTHPVASTWLALTFFVWIAIYVSTESGRRRRAVAATRIRSDQA